MIGNISVRRTGRRKSSMIYVRQNRGMIDL
jgi:hypothetical protein